MHDLVHDLAMIFAGEFCSRAEEHEKAVEIGMKTRHLSHIAKEDYPISKLLEVCDRIKHTRTFLEINLNKWESFNVENAPCILLLSQLKYLRALSFKSVRLESLPDSIGKLTHLRYLNLSHTNIVSLPESLGSLYKLQTLKLYGCGRLKMLPVSMQDLVNLRHLDIRRTRLNEMPRGMSKLKSLQFLSDYVVGKDEGNKIRELGALANLHQSICISHLENVVNTPQLENLVLVGCTEMDFSPTGDPPRSLRYLEISYSDKLASSATLMNSQFHWLTQLSIQSEFGGASVKSFPKEGWLPASLEILRLNNIKSVETLECKGLAHLTSLQALDIYGCHKLENIEGEKLPASLILLNIDSIPLLGKRCELGKRCKMKDPQ
ncbi:hypothetical protein PIB30_108443, partial [Stylosanthes scabra]|nr:hypothetical protein [Stylosanthes scabra]